MGLGAPTGTPSTIVDRLNAEINIALSIPSMNARLTELGGTPITGSPANFGKLIADETEKWAKAAVTVLADFMVMHPDARIEVVVDTSQALVDAMEAGKLDQAITVQVNTRLPHGTLGLGRMRWIGNRQRSLIDGRPLPLVMLEEPCAFRRAALAALDEAGIPWRIVLVSA